VQQVRSRLASQPGGFAALLFWVETVRHDRAPLVCWTRPSCALRSAIWSRIMRRPACEWAKAAASIRIACGAGVFYLDWTALRAPGSRAAEGSVERSWFDAKARTAPITKPMSEVTTTRMTAVARLKARIWTKVWMKLIRSTKSMSG